MTPPIFERYPNIEESEEDLIKFMRHGKNCQDFLDEFVEEQPSSGHKAVFDSKFSEW